MSSSDGFSLAKTLIRTCVRTFYGTRQILIIDALFTHSVLHADDLAVLFSSQAKDIRRNVQALLTARLIAKGTRAEVKIGHARQANREYYYIPLHPAIDAIKFKITRLRKKAASLYEVDVERKDWKCPRCKAEWTELEVLDKVGPEGFECHRCGNTLDFNEDAQGGEEGKHKHEKIKRLNHQLKVFDDLIIRIDDVNVPENAFDDAWLGKIEVPKMKGSGLVRSEHMYVGRGTAFVKGEGPGSTDASRLQINISSGADQERQEEERKEARRKELAKQNQLPEWHTTIAGVKNEAQVKAEASATSGSATDRGSTSSTNAALKKDEGGENKNGVLSIEEEMRIYMEDMAREKEEAEKAAALEDAEDQDDGDDEDFEDVITPSAANTPMGSQSLSTDRLARPPINGIKRDSDYDDSEAPSEANTPATGAATPERASKRPKLGDTLPTKEPEDSEEDEDFEDAI
jgi:transcription initiation factor TFIIE subunit alpha